MPTINVTLPSDGTTADVGDYNSVITAMLDTINGQLDDDNIASLSGTKITPGTLDSEAFTSEARKGWVTDILPAPSTVTDNGQNSYDLVFNSTDLTDDISPGMRIRTTRSVAAPIRCTSLNGTTQYYSKSSPNKMTFTDDFAVSGWVKITSYAGGAIVSRYNGTSGLILLLNTNGTLSLQGFNGGAGNSSIVTSNQSLPLNKWIHVAAQLDMSAFTATTTTSYIMIGGVDVPAVVSRTGTNPTALVQAGDLQIGARNSGLFFSGKIAQVSIFSAKVTQATMLSYMSQGMSGSETNLASAYSFDNSIIDLNTTTPNDLTANGSAVATSADSPFGGQADGTISSTLDYGIIMAISFSTNTTVTVQTPEGCTIPVTGGVSEVDYTSLGCPYGMPMESSKYDLVSLWKVETNVTSNASYGLFANSAWRLTVPKGKYKIGYDLVLSSTVNVRVTFNLSPTSIVGVASGAEDTRFSADILSATNGAGMFGAYNRRIPIVLSSNTTYTMYTIGATTGAVVEGDNMFNQIVAENQYVN